MVLNSSERATRQGALAAQLAFRRALLDVSGSTRRLSAEFSRLQAPGRGLGGGHSIFVRYADDGARQLRWMDAQLSAATRLATAASQVEDPDMQLALLRLAGPRLESALLGSLLVSVWIDLLHLADTVCTQHFYSVERMFADLGRWQHRLEPTLAALSTLEPGQVEAAAQAVPMLVAHLTGEFTATVQKFREWFEKRGFTGEMDIDQFCVEMQQAHHEAIHGGGNWKLGRQWPGEWNRMLMDALHEAEVTAGRMLTRNGVLDIVAERMEEYNLAMNFIPWRGR
ncbi:hypothetical protein ACN28S_28785 [Cystobacter fuscus]